MKLGTKLTLYLSLIIVLILSGYGYVDILSRQDVLGLIPSDFDQSPPYKLLL